MGGGTIILTRGMGEPMYGLLLPSCPVEHLGGLSNGTYSRTEDFFAGHLCLYCSLTVSTLVCV